MGPKGQEPHGVRRPPELEERLRKLSRYEAAVVELHAFREARARADPVKALCLVVQDGLTRKVEKVGDERWRIAGSNERSR